MKKNNMIKRYLLCARSEDVSRFIKHLQDKKIYYRFHSVSDLGLVYFIYAKDSEMILLKLAFSLNAIRSVETPEMC